MKKSLLFFTLGAFSLSQHLYAQVTIGSGMPNEKGALLQLKDTQAAEGDITATKGGLLLPRVRLTQQDELYPFYSSRDLDYMSTGGTRERVKNRHKGLVVYNLTVDATENLEIGLYQWNGLVWIKIDGGPEPWNLVGSATPATKNTQDIYQAGRVGVGFGDAQEFSATSNVITLEVKAGDALINGMTVGKGIGGGIGGNTVIGEQALHNNMDGEHNVAIGKNALRNNLDGIKNVAIGQYALANNKSGLGNVAVGQMAFTSNESGNGNVAIGEYALGNSTAGHFNTVVGYQALARSFGTGRNTAIGSNALQQNSTGSYNTAISVEALFNNTTGKFNVATGAQSLYNNTEGSQNIAIGYEAMHKNRTGSNNVALGNFAGPVESVNSAFNRTITIGHAASASGNNAIAIGYAVEAEQDAIVIGNADHKTTILKGVYPNLATASDYRVMIDANGVLKRGLLDMGSISDNRYTENVKTMPLGLSFINQIRPIEYESKKDVQKIKEWGIDAQELQQTLQAIDYQNSGLIQTDNTPEQALSVRYVDLIAPLIKAMQELSAKSIALEAELQTLKDKVESTVPE